MLVFALTFAGLFSATFGLSKMPGPPGPPGPPATSAGHAGMCSTEGAEFSNQNFWYRCERDPKTNELVAKVQGCINPGAPSPNTGVVEKRIGPGQTFHLRDAVMQCRRDEPGDTWAQSAVGCLGSTVGATPGSSRSEHKVGETWDEGEGVSGDTRIKYKMRCDQVGPYHVTRKAVQCVYSSSEGNGPIDGGCMKRFGDILVQCIKREGRGDRLRAQVVIAPNEQVQQDAAGLGLKMC